MITVDKYIFPVMFLAALGCGLMAGVFFTFSVFVMKALARLPANQGMAAMQGINAAILNPLFFTVFFGTTTACGLAVVSALGRWHDAGAAYRLAGGALYLVGSFLVTVVFNVPLNERLAAANPADPEAATIWARYLANWTAWNHVRTVAALAGAASLTMALCAYSKSS